MAVHPIEERYGTTEMRAVWSEKYRFACVVAAEVALAKAEAAHGMIPAEAAAGIGRARTGSIPGTGKGNRTRDQPRHDGDRESHLGSVRGFRAMGPLWRNKQ